MKQLTQYEFEERMDAIQRARRIFIESGLTKNITHAFEIYQEVFAERERELFLSSVLNGNRAQTVMDRYIRPKCPDCQSDMMFRLVPENKEGVKTQLVCSGCPLVLDSEKDLTEWMRALKVKDGV